jgi:hypothetical protein
MNLNILVLYNQVTSHWSTYLVGGYQEEYHMGRRRRIVISDEQRTQLLQLRDKASKPYLRERAAAILKIADGTPLLLVASQGLLRKRDYNTLSAWLDRFESEGTAGLTIRRGRGRKPAFSPSAR